MSFSESLYQMIKQPRQTYFLLFMNKQQKLGLDSLYSFHSFRSRWCVRNHFFAKYSDVNYFVLYATFNKVMASFITLTLQSRWCVRNISLQSAMTWIILFSMQFLKIFEVYLPFTLSYQTKIFPLYVILSEV